MPIRLYIAQVWLLYEQHPCDFKLPFYTYNTWTIVILGLKLTLQLHVLVLLIIEILYYIVNVFCYPVREYVVIEESEWCPAGIIEHFEKFKMASISWFQDGLWYNRIFIQQVYIFK